jgi:glycerophosphoryl diester phosphodiesterase
MKLIPWTVNDPKIVEELIELGIDGIITDYPDMVIETWESLQPAN